MMQTALLDGGRTATSATPLLPILLSLQSRSPTAVIFIIFLCSFNLSLHLYSHLLVHNLITVLAVFLHNPVPSYLELNSFCCRTNTTFMSGNSFIRYTFWHSSFCSEQTYIYCFSLFRVSHSDNCQHFAPLININSTVNL